MKITRFTLAAVLWIGLLATMQPADRYVVVPGTAGGTSTGPFTNWSIAATQIQWAVNIATNANDTVWVSNGSYRVTNQITITNNITVKSKNGYASTIVFADWPTWITRCFYVSATGTVDGFTITNGHYWASNNYDGGGGAFLSNGTIQNCYFSYNVCSNSGTYVGGGGLYIKNGTVSNCTFFTNTSMTSVDPWGGGAIMINAQTYANILSCQIISNNITAGRGAGIHTDNTQEASPFISNCNFNANNGGAYRAIYSTKGYMVDCGISNHPSGSEAVACWQGGMRNCIVANNSGGGVHFTYGGSATNCTFRGNSKTTYGAGASMGPESTTPSVLERCTFSNNICTAGDGGGGVGISRGNGGFAILRNCLIHHNTNMSATGYGGGVFLTNAAISRTGMVINCTIANNYSTNEGGGICAAGLSNYIVNCVIAGNNSSSGNYPNVYYQDNIDANKSNFYYSCAVTTDAYLFAAGQGNITNDPVFLGANNWRLGTNSPCINTGTNQSWMTNAYDLDGLSRIVQDTIDMGAYESEYFFSVNPAAFSNTVMRGSATNFSSFLTNSSSTQIYWQAANTSSWVALSASSGTIETNATYTATVTNFITNSALALAPGAYYSRLAFSPTNIPPAAMLYYPQTGTVDMTLNVAEFGRSPTQLTASLKQFGTTSTNVSIWNTGAGELSYSVSTNVSWLAASPAGGVLTGQTAGATNALTVVFTNTSLPVGTHNGALTLVPVGIVGPSLTINVELTITTGPQMVVNPMILTGTVMMGQNFASQTMRVSNGSSTEQIGYGITTNRSWLAVSPTNGTVAALGTNELVVSYPTSGLTTNSAGGPSNYNATITVTATNSDAIGSPAEVAVNLTVNPKARLNLSTALLTNIVTEGYDAPDCTFEIWNGNGYYTLSYTISDNADWFVLTPASGTSIGEHNVITAEFSTAGFTAGVSNALITVVGRTYDGTHYDSALDATQTVWVSLMITPATELATDASATYAFSARLGHPAGSASFHVWNSSAGGGTLQYAIATDASWLAARPVSGTSAGEVNEIVFTCNSDNLRPGKYIGALTISGINQATGTEARNSPTNINVDLTILGEKGFDFGGDGNGASDLIVYQESSGLWNITNLFSGYTTNVMFGGKGYVPVPGDFDGDQISDLGAYRYSSGYWYVRRLTDQLLSVLGGSYWAGPELASLGGYVSVAGDYDGDGKTDPAMYCERSGLWSGLFSASGYAYVSGLFGGPGYTAIPADYDGDGQTDPAVYNETTAQWYLLYSSDNYRIISGIFGGPGFTAAPADYDGDGKADGCIYNEATGLWIILPSSTLSSSGYALVTGVFGGPGFKPVPADYDGNGKADICVYDEATGNWYIVSIDGTVVAWPARHGGYGFAPVKP